MSAIDERFMRAALTLAIRGLGRAWPNPAVGCVIVNGNRIVGRGWTQPGGRPHAETSALAQAGDSANGATAYVTLEPCAHHGQTPPCADALAGAGIARVVAAIRDPDPRVDGEGLARLSQAGIAAQEGVCAGQATALQQGYLTRICEGRPMVTLKLAVSVDGRIATATGESKWITGPYARRAAHSMRALQDAVLVGGGTARADDPSLTVRGLGVAHQPVRVVWSRHLDLPIKGKLAQTTKDAPVWICHGTDADAALRSAWSDLGAKLLPVPISRAKHLDPVAALREMGNHGLTRVFCEGGGTLAASLLSAGAVDRLVVFGSGVGLGAEGRPSLGALGIDILANAPRFDLVDLRNAGGDALQIWERAAPPA